jgi:hypothetical protein
VRVVLTCRDGQEAGYTICFRFVWFGVLVV